MRTFVSACSPLEFNPCRTTRISAQLFGSPQFSSETACSNLASSGKTKTSHPFREGVRHVRHIRAGQYSAAKKNFGKKWPECFSAWPWLYGHVRVLRLNG